MAKRQTAAERSAETARVVLVQNIKREWQRAREARVLTPEARWGEDRALGALGHAVDEARSAAEDARRAADSLRDDLARFVGRFEAGPYVATRSTSDPLRSSRTTDISEKLAKAQALWDVAGSLAYALNVVVPEMEAGGPRRRREWLASRVVETHATSQGSGTQLWGVYMLTDDEYHADGPVHMSEDEAWLQLAVGADGQFVR